MAHLEPLVLEHSFDGGIFARWGKLRLENNAEGPVANDLALSILHLARLSSQSILDLFANDLCNER